MVDFTSGVQELFRLNFYTQSDCSIWYILVSYKDTCDTYTNSAITVDISAVNGESQDLFTGVAETVAVKIRNIEAGSY